MREFNTFGPCDPAHNYIVPRTTDIADFVQRLKKGRYIVIFAPRQTGKTTFFRWALEALTNEDDTYLPIQLNFEDYNDLSSEEFYHCLKEEIIQEIDSYEPLQNNTALSQFLADYAMTSHVSMRKLFEKLAEYLKNRRVSIIIEEFDGINPRRSQKFFAHFTQNLFIKKTKPLPVQLGHCGCQKHHPT
jgi:predicted AAA+ superfamily ATPase